MVEKVRTADETSPLAWVSLDALGVGVRIRCHREPFEHLRRDASCQLDSTCLNHMASIFFCLYRRPNFLESSHYNLLVFFLYPQIRLLCTAKENSEIVLLEFLDFHLRPFSSFFRFRLFDTTFFNLVFTYFVASSPPCWQTFAHNFWKLFFAHSRALFRLISFFENFNAYAL